MTIYWLSKFYSKERRILFRMDETLHHVDVPHPIHFLTHPNCLLFFICVCVCMCRYFLEWETIPSIYINICAQTHSVCEGWEDMMVSAYICPGSIPSHKDRAPPRPPSFSTPSHLYHIYIYIYWFVRVSAYVLVCVCVYAIWTHLFLYCVCVCVCMKMVGKKSGSSPVHTHTHTHTQKKKMRYRFQSQGPSKSDKS